MRALTSIRLDGVSKPGGVITIVDNGTGMSREDIKSGWLVLGKSRKSNDKPTPLKGRRTVGDKGFCPRLHCRGG